MAFPVTGLAQTITVKSFNASEVDISDVAHANLAAGSDHSLTISSNARRLRIIPSGTGSTAIGRLTLTGGPASGNLNVEIGDTDYEVTDTTPTRIPCASWAGLNASGLAASVGVYGGITGDLSNTMTGIDRLSRFDVLGNIDAPIEIGAPDGVCVITSAAMSSLGYIKLNSGNMDRISFAGGISRPNSGSFPDTASINIVNGDLTLLELGGSLRGDVLARQGRIREINVDGVIGRSWSDESDPNNPESATAFPELVPSEVNGDVLCIEARNGIDLIEADEMCCIIEADREFGSPGAVGKLEVLRTRGTVSRAGSFKGLIKAEAIGDNEGMDVLDTLRVSIAGDFRGRVNLPDTGLQGELDGTFRVGGSLKPLSLTVSGSPVVQKAFNLKTDGLIGQIVINANNAGGTWDAQVAVGSTNIPASLTSAYTGDYAPVPTSLGGGSIGIAPFQLHKEACTPIHDDPSPSLTSIFDPNAEPCGLEEPIVIRSYGPITKGAASSWMDVIRVEATMSGGSCGWVDVSTLFTAQLSTDPAEGGRALVLKKGNPSDKDPAKLRYRVVPVRVVDEEEFAIMSRDVTGTPSVVWPVDCDSEPTEAEAYLFSLDLDCNSNCVADSTDIDNTPSLDVDPEDGYIDECQIGGCHACDLADDDMLDLADLVTFLSDWQPNIGQTVSAGTNGDYNCDTAVDLADLIAFLTCWQPNVGLPCE